MTIDTTDLKKAAEACDISKCSDDAEYGRRLAEFFEQCEPESILALLAEIERLETWRTAFLAEREAQIRQRDQLRADNEALRNALGDLLALYEDDEGCRSLPEYIAGRAAMAKEAGHG